MNTLKFTADTFLKKDTAQAATLPDDKRWPIPAGKELPVLAVSPTLVDGHALVTFAQGYGPHGYNSWFVFAEHIDIDEIIHPVPTDKPSPPASPVLQVTLPGIGTLGLSDRLPGCKYFTVAEFTHGGSRIPRKGNIPADTTPERVVSRAIALAKELDKIRERYNAPIAVNSWFRDTITNARVGGATGSRHLYGDAVDIVIAGVHSQQVLRDYANWPGGLAGTRTNLFTHFDLRGWRSRWTYPF